jgi:hypothetical protein
VVSRKRGGRKEREKRKEGRMEGRREAGRRDKGKEERRREKGRWGEIEIFSKVESTG